MPGLLQGWVRRVPLAWLLLLLVLSLALLLVLLWGAHVYLLKLPARCCVLLHILLASLTLQLRCMWLLMKLMGPGKAFIRAKGIALQASWHVTL